ncbi:unnamed protein product [Polarella glacialis]|uniref:Uncharacterized protein n=1 Tax=Polarella glacialis TaxID=89957 RepID=A0A813HZV5_POLGL|nr:unnamed protein product [Polarella glacialis]
MQPEGGMSETQPSSQGHYVDGEFRVMTTGHMPPYVENPRPLTQLPSETAEALKKFVRRNKPPIDRSRFNSASSANSASADVGEEKRIIQVNSGPLPAPRGFTSEHQYVPGQTDESFKKAEIKDLAENLKKFDIFDTISEERILEFEAIAEASRQGSNYKEYKQKTRKLDPNKFSSVAVVTRGEDGKSVVT